MSVEPGLVTLLVTGVFEELNIPYLIGGSVAGTIHGVVRTTLDADIVAELEHQHLPQLVQKLQPEFYLDQDAVTRAVQDRGSFNLIHQATMFKVDIFVSKGRPFDQSQFARRAAQVVVTEPEQVAFVASAEDTILAKLEWFRLGDEVSDRQWRDILGVIRIQADRLDLVYLRRWATDLDVPDLLEKALGEAAR